MCFALLAIAVRERRIEIHRVAFVGAIGHRLRLLEKILLCQLFRRQGSQLRLTEYGEALAPALSGGFDRIIAALSKVGHADPNAHMKEFTRTDHV